MSRIHVILALLLLYCRFSFAEQDKDTQQKAASTKSDAKSEAKSEWVLPNIAVPHLQRRIFESKAAKTKVSYFIYLPETYESEKERRFPVLYWLHGSGGGLAGVRPLVTYFNAAIAAGKIPPMLIVFANGLSSSMWCDASDGSVPMETIMVKELLPEIDSHFRTKASREGRLIEGFSMGGYGAARLGFTYPDLFGAVSMLGAGPLDLAFRGPRANANPSERERILRPWQIVEHNAAAIRGKVRVRQVIGALDNTLPLNRAFEEHLTKQKIPHSFTVVPAVDHDTLAIFTALGEKNGEFYRSLFEPSKERAKVDRIVAKRRIYLDSIVLEIVDLESATIQQCRDFAWARTVELDSEVDPKKKGVTILIPQNLDQCNELHEPEISYRAKNITLTNLLKEMARQSGLDVYTTSVGVVFCLPGRAPFPNAAEDKGDIWEAIYKTPQKLQRDTKDSGGQPATRSESN
jgi:enterochelin esterase-like enzyme